MTLALYSIEVTVHKIQKELLVYLQPLLRKLNYKNVLLSLSVDAILLLQDGHHEENLFGGGIITNPLMYNNIYIYKYIFEEKIKPSVWHLEGKISLVHCWSKSFI